MDQAHVGENNFHTITKMSECPSIKFLKNQNSTDQLPPKEDNLKVSHKKHKRKSKYSFLNTLERPKEIGVEDDVPITRNEIKRSHFQSKILNKYLHRSPSKFDEFENNDENKISIYFQNKVDKKSRNLKDFAIVKCPTFKKCAKMYKIRSRGNVIKFTHKIRKTIDDPNRKKL